MNKHAIHYGGQPGFDRRVGQREFESVLGCKTSWFGELERRGVVPPAHRDPGGKRKWWFASEVTQALEGLGKPATEVAA